MQKIKYHTRKIIVTIIGWVVVVLGLIMLVTPGPGWVFIIMGLGILASEYAWAHNLLQKAKNKYEQIKTEALKKANKNKPNNK